MANVSCPRSLLLLLIVLNVRSMMMTIAPSIRKGNDQRRKRVTRFTVAISFPISLPISHHCDLNKRENRRYPADRILPGD